MEESGVRVEHRFAIFSIDPMHPALWKILPVDGPEYWDIRFGDVAIFGSPSQRKSANPMRGSFCGG